MSLRSEAIEVLYPFMDGDYNPDEWAAQALDALLDYLTAHDLKQRKMEWPFSFGEYLKLLRVEEGDNK